MCRVRVSISVAVMALLSTTLHVRADVHPAIVPGTDALSGATYVLAADPIATPATHSGPASKVSDISFAGLAGAEWVHSDGAEPPASVPAGSASLSEHAEIRDLPPLPGSASLFLSAMLSIGGWHVLRSARHIHLGALPEWYHTDGPDQIGHTASFDLNFSALPLCCFEQPVGERPSLFRVRRDQRPRCDARSFVTPAAPRGPPALP